jgi:uncharacterized phage-associated protein
MTFDPRAVTNALLDAAEAQRLFLTNLSLNKILYFAHAEFLVTHKYPLVNLTFEAWEFGPVMPIIYRQFKKYGPRPIHARAFTICPKTGADVEFEYHHLRIDQQFVFDVISRYGSLSATKLVAISHEPGGPWHQVWHGSSETDFGMTIPNELIARNYLLPKRPEAEFKHVH